MWQPCYSQVMRVLYFGFFIYLQYVVLTHKDIMCDSSRKYKDGYNTIQYFLDRPVEALELEK